MSKFREQLNDQDSSSYKRGQLDGFESGAKAMKEAMTNTNHSKELTEQEKQWREEAEKLYPWREYSESHYNKLIAFEQNAYIAGRKASLLDKKQVASDAWDAAVEAHIAAEMNYDHHGSMEKYEKAMNQRKQTYLSTL